MSSVFRNTLTFQVRFHTVAILAQFVLAQAMLAQMLQHLLVAITVADASLSATTKVHSLIEDEMGGG